MELSKKFEIWDTEWISGVQIEGLRFLHNSLVEATMPDGTKKIGWIVGARMNSPEPVYTVEAQDGSGDMFCVESRLKVLNG